MFEKRGLSAVVTTLIIILLALVSIGVVWVVVRNVVQEGSEQIDLGAFTLDLQIKKVEITDDNVNVTVYVKRNPGPGNFIGINFIFSDGKNSEVIRENIILAELEERSFTFTLNEINVSDLETVSIAPIFELSSGSESTGDFSDMFDVGEGVSVVTGTGSVVGGSSGGNFEALGFVGSEVKEYIFSSQSEEIVKFSRAVVNPLDVLPGDNQTFTVEVSSPNGIANVTSITELDNSILNLDFEHISGDAGGVETWFASWIVNDTHTIEYRTRITATDTQENSNSVTLTWTDSCQSDIVHGAAESSIDTSCTTGVDSVGGMDGGNIVLGENVQLTIESGSTFIFNQGQSIEITAAGAQIVSESGAGSFGNGYLFYVDVDGDNSPNGSILSFSTISTSLSGFVRAKDAFTTDDCNDASSVVNTTRTQYLDNDTDGYFVVGSSFCASDSTYSDSVCSTAGSDYANSTGSCLRITTNGTADCYDANADANPGQTSLFTTDRGDGDFDYDCSGAGVPSIGTKYTNCDCGSCVSGFCNGCQGTGGSSTTESDCGSSRQVACITGACESSCSIRSCCDGLMQTISCR